MVKLLISREDGRPLYVFGLSAKNIELLLQGNPIAFSLEEMEGEGDVAILYGETEESMVAELREVFGIHLQPQEPQ